MLEVVTTQIPGQCQVFFNISGNVGIKSPNDPIDVELVQLGYYCAAINPANSAPPDVKAIYKLVRPGEAYAGSPTDPLTRAIEADQRFRQVKYDGHVSRMHGGVRYSGPRGKEPFILSSLGNNIFDIMSAVYPRIDLDSRCPAKLAAHIKNLFRN